MDTRGIKTNQQKFIDEIQKIRSILANPAGSSETTYTLFIDKELKRRVTVAERQAILQISSLHPDQSIQALAKLYLEVNATIPKQAENMSVIDKDEMAQIINCELIQGKIPQLLEQFQNNTIGAKTLLKSLYYECIIALEGIKTTFLAYEKASAEFKCWLEGFCLQLMIELRREEIRQAISSDTENETAHFIKDKVIKNNKGNEIPVQIKKGLHKALTIMSDIDPKESLLILISIVQSFKNNISENNKLAELHPAIDAIIKHFDEAHVKYHLDQDSQKKILNKKAKQIPLDLEQFVKTMDSLVVTAETLPFIQELAIWLQSLYLHSYMHNTMTENIYLKLTIGLKKTGLDKYYLTAAEHLDEKIIAFHHAKLTQQNTVVPNSDNNNVPVIENKKIDEDNRGPLLPQPEIEEFIPGFETLLSDSQLKPINEKAFWKMLDQVKDCDESVQLSTFSNAVDAYSLSEELKKHSAHLKVEVPPIMNQYNEDTYLKKIPLVGAIVAKVMPRKSKDLADETLAKFKVSKDNELEGKLDPREQLLQLFQIRPLLKVRNSKLLPKVDEILLKTYRIYLSAKPEEVCEPVVKESAKEDHGIKKEKKSKKSHRDKSSKNTNKHEGLAFFPSASPGGLSMTKSDAPTPQTTPKPK